ncbi:hypothetical protein HGP14_05610 [Rhizobium sp. P32RR-XVIII]|uniref:hypothetical protein n=1 Tax=Rhizobium sp. P32RR-XVIII TaxID=2726738 RepID=UPI0014579372|nr:hypothetical protein [Rhizobium sp. P32RR-XVIII]NLS02848.1 hypothetical protein [Rhizobium sp. P32RR-XVIII]
MANFLITYDLNGPAPSHKQMDDHLLALGPAFLRGRILETVWFLAGPTNSPQLRDYIRRILSQNDLLIVTEMADAAWTRLLVDGNAFKASFEANERSKAA